VLLNRGAQDEAEPKTVQSLASCWEQEFFFFSSAWSDLLGSRACAEHYSWTRHFRCCYLNTLLTAATSAATPTEVLPWFSSVVRRMPGYKFYAKTGHGPHSPPGTAASPKCLYTVALLKAATLPFWVQIPESLPTKVCPPTFMCLIKRKPFAFPSAVLKTAT
jgi:hypothetical protein